MSDPVYRMLVAYDGAPFHGFARQKDLPTVQGVLEEALGAVLRVPVATTVAGRTDAGVHALGQVVSFTMQTPVEDLPALSRRLNGICRPTIAVLDIEEAPEGFDARFSALSRSYEYAIFTRAVHDPLSRHVTWHHPDPPLDEAAMHEAAQFLVGSHDFASFGRVPEGKTSVRELQSISVQRSDDLVTIDVTANAFIQQMVRSIVGTLVKVGEGARPPAWVNEVLEAKDRSAAGPVAPAHGLLLVEVAYPDWTAPAN
ncbi:MAG: tRNA pseudouridine(38-40) synthase TruA [Actinomycetota bacterium]